MKAVIAGFARSPFTPATKGELAGIRPDEIAAQVIAALVGQSGIPSEDIEDLIVGCAFPEGEQGLNVARMIGLRAGLPVEVPAATVNRLCGSSMLAVHAAAGAVAARAGEVFVCAGVESMTRVPVMGFNPLPHPALARDVPAVFMSMGETAENVARRFGIGRDEQDGFAVESHRRAAAAGRPETLVPIRDGGRMVENDGCVRADTAAATLARLPPAFRADGTVTAGTASPLTDGAAAVLVCSEAWAERAEIRPLARIRAMAVSGCAPEIMGMGPVEASRKALARAGLTVADLDVVELNEAFAAQALVCIRALGLDPDTVNIEGGAIALGHPLGASGARIIGQAATLLARRRGEFALATLCVGGGQGIATVLESVW